LTGAKIKEVEALKPDMILLTGGVMRRLGDDSP
jgi:hypothetical protein